VVEILDEAYAKFRGNAPLREAAG